MRGYVVINLSHLNFISINTYHLQQEADKWIVNLQDILDAKEEDGKVTFSCEFSKPGGKLRWFKERQEIFHGFKIHFTTEGPVHKITINKLSADDSARYICKIDGIETSAQLEVKRKHKSLTIFIKSFFWYFLRNK